MKKVFLLCLATIAIAISTPAQNGFTTVTGAIVDPNGIPWTGGTISAQLLTPGGAAPTLNGVSFTSTSNVGLLGPGGTFTFRLGDNGVISPAGTTWKFTINISPGVPAPLGKGPQSFTVTTAINCGTNTPATCTSNQITITAALAPVPALSNSSGGAPVLATGGIDTGVTNAYVFATNPNTVGLTVGASFTGQVANANTSASTINVNGTGVKPLVASFNLGSGLAFTGGELAPGVTYLFSYTGSVWYVANSIRGSAGTPASPSIDLTNGFTITSKNGGTNFPTVTISSGDLSNVQNNRQMLLFSCQEGSGSCSGGKYFSIGFDGDGFFLFDSNSTLAVEHPTINFSTISFTSNSGNPAQTVFTINPSTTQTSGNVFNYQNNGGSNLFKLESVTGKPSTDNFCAVNNASPAACGSSWTGSFVVPTTTTTYTVNTTAVTTHSRIFLFPHTDTRDLPGAPTCVVPVITAAPVVSATIVGTSFTITISSTTGQTCWDYFITGT